MPSQALYDFAPALRLMLLGAVIAMGPLAWVWLRNRQASLPQRLRALTWLTLFLTFDLVLFGAFTRLTDSGLGCPDWPGCYASASPMGAAAQISAEQAAMPHGPVTHQKAWIEMVHRYLASAVGVLILVLAASTWLHRQQLRRRLRISPWWPTVTLLWVCVQGAFGALTVTMKLFPAIVTMHLLGGMVLLALLQAQATRYRLVDSFADANATLLLSRSVFTWLLLGFGLLWLQIALGGWVSTNYAVLACNEFPQCQGQWVPAMNLREGFELWRGLGQSAAGSTISLPALTAIHVVHRMFAFAVFAVLGVAAWHMHRSSVPGSAARTAAIWIALLLLWQLITGLSNVVLGWPLLAAVSHTGGAAGLVVVITGVLSAAQLRQPSQDAVSSGYESSPAATSRYFSGSTQ
ncbi:MAG: COX15/CtaA family protein [Burkholderiaceae bacterium]